MGLQFSIMAACRAIWFGWRSLVTAIAAACYLIGSLGALPSHQAIVGWFGERSSERFMCESDGCGCATAHQCWTSCCCHSLTERLAWAIREGVAPPAFVKFSDEQWLAAMNSVEPGKAHCELCVDEAKSKLACGEFTACSDDRGAIAENVAHTPRSGSSVSPLSCKGVSTLVFVSVPPALPLAAVVVFPGSERVVAMTEIRDDLASSRGLDVPAPPPRTAA